jgi:hypothetical protein
MLNFEEGAEGRVERHVGRIGVVVTVIQDMGGEKVVSFPIIILEWDKCRESRQVLGYKLWIFGVSMILVVGVEECGEAAQPDRGMFISL